MTQEEVNERVHDGENLHEEAQEEDEDEDGLGGSSSPISVDKQYLGETAADEVEEKGGAFSQSVQRWKVQHGPGDFKYPGKGRREGKTGSDRVVELSELV